MFLSILNSQWKKLHRKFYICTGADVIYASISNNSIMSEEVFFNHPIHQWYLFLREHENFYVADSLAVCDQLYGTSCAIGWIRNHNIGKCTQILFYARSFEARG